MGHRFRLLSEYVKSIAAWGRIIRRNLREYRHMTVTIDLPKEVEARLLSEARASGVPFGQIVKEVLIDHFEEIEDLLVAESRLEDRQAPITVHQLRKNLGLDD